MTSNYISTDIEKSIIQISGLKRSGKDWTAKAIKEIIESNGGTVEILSFAEPMKQIISTMLSIEPELLEELKNNKLNIYYSRNNEMEFMTDARSMIMHFGNEGMKSVFGDDVWVNLMKKRIKESTAEVIIISDFRFNVEHFTEALTVKIVNNSLVNDTTHASENELENFKFDVVLDNTDYCLTAEIIKAEMLKQTENLQMETYNA